MNLTKVAAWRVASNHKLQFGTAPEYRESDVCDYYWINMKILWKIIVQYIRLFRHEIR